MTKKLFIAAAAFLILTPAALAQPAGVGAGAGSAGGAASATGPSVSAQINATLQAAKIPPAGQSPGSDFTTVGGASAGTGLRMPSPSTGTYTGPAAPTFGQRATPYTGPRSASAPAGVAPYTGPGVVSGSAGGAPDR